MTVQSIRTAVEVRNIGGNHLFVTAREVSCREMNGIGKLNHLAQEIRPHAKTLDNAGHLLPSRTGPPEVIGAGGFPGSLMILNNLDLWRRLRLLIRRFARGILHGLFSLLHT